MFNPDEIIVADSCIQLIGNTIAFNPKHECSFNKSEPKTYVGSVANIHLGGEDVHNIYGWCDIDFNQIKDMPIIYGEVVDCYMAEHMNGGRDNATRYQTVNEYFSDPLVKQRVMQHSYGDMVDRMQYSGNPDQVDLVVVVKFGYNNTIAHFNTKMYDAEPPMSWYTEKFGDLPQFKFSQGFFANSTDAIKCFDGQCEDDLFGSRYFPVVVVPMTVEKELVDELVYIAKGHSNFLVIDDNWVVGLRCKPDEYQDCIEKCYEIGGKVPIGVCFDWI